MNNKELQELLKQYPDNALLEIIVDGETQDLAVKWVDPNLFESKKIEGRKILTLTIGVSGEYLW